MTDPKPTLTNAGVIVQNAIRNVWNMGGLVAVATLDSESQEKLAQVAEVNAMSEIEKAMDIKLMEDDQK